MQRPMAKPRTHPGVDIATPTSATTMERWTVMISWLIASPFLFLSLWDQREGVVCKHGVPSLTSHSLHISHGCSLCGPLWSAIGPSPHSPLGSDNVSLKPKLQSVWLCACGKGNAKLLQEQIHLKCENA